MRRSGRTTRLADEAIQAFFEGKTLLLYQRGSTDYTRGYQNIYIVKDHYYDTKEANNHLWTIIRNRLIFEHSSLDAAVFTYSVLMLNPPDKETIVS